MQDDSIIIIFKEQRLGGNWLRNHAKRKLDESSDVETVDGIILTAKVLEIIDPQE